MGRISALTEVSELASNDYLVVLDTSANIAKKVSVANALGIPDFGFVATGESWTYSAYDTVTRIAEITVPTDATTKYQDGMRVKFTQPTDGEKFGIIMKVEATLLHIFMHADYDLDNEAITTPFYSSEYAPYGFDLNPTKWKLEYTRSTQDSQASPVSGTLYQLNANDELVVGVGAYDVGYQVGHYAAKASGSLDFETTLTTVNNSVTDDDYTIRSQMTGSSPTQFINNIQATKYQKLNTETTFYLNSGVRSASHSLIGHDNDDSGLRIWAKCAYI